MKKISNLSDLLQQLRENLQDHRYKEYEEIELNKINLKMHIIKTSRSFFEATYLCALFELPIEISSTSEFKGLQRKIRFSFTKTYGHFPYIKGTGAFLILFCSNEQYAILKNDLSSFYDTIGLYGTMMLGCILINKDTFELIGDRKWGLSYSGPHFVDMRRVARDWCKTQA